MKLDDADTGDYEMSPQGQANDGEPLLPRYERHSTSQPRNHKTGRPQPSSLRRFLSCLCIALLVLIPSVGFAGCYAGRQTIDKVRDWNRLPDDWREWLGKMAQQTATKPDSSNFPTNIGYAGPTPTGSEPALITAPAPPRYTNVAPLVPPTKPKGSFSIMQHWGNLAPYFSVESHGLPEDQPLVPEECELDELHWLQRHGARYPTVGMNGPAGFVSRLKEAAKWTAKGELEFLNEWEYKLGAEVLTPFGRKQLFDLGASARIKYGSLLDKFKGRLPVLRTESQDRMLKSAQNFAAGFFGIPAEEQYNLEVTIESPGFNNTLAPWTTCTKANDPAYPVAFEEMAKWDKIFLADAARRLKAQLDGYDLTIRDVKDMMELCAYETVSLGYSSFCELFTKDEWKGFEYRNELFWWHSSSFGYPRARAQGKGWAQELLSRLTHTRLTTFDSTTNSSFHNDVHFPLNDPLYIDFTHDSEFALLLPTLNLTSFAATGTPPSDHIPKHRSYIASQFCPFATNLQVQVLSCKAKSDRQIRIILNDAPVPLDGINGCGEDAQGLCPFESFVSSVQKLVDEVSWEDTCV